MFSGVATQCARTASWASSGLLLSSLLSPSSSRFSSLVPGAASSASVSSTRITSPFLGRTTSFYGWWREWMATEQQRHDHLLPPVPLSTTLAGACTQTSPEEGKQVCQLMGKPLRRLEWMTGGLYGICSVWRGFRHRCASPWLSWSTWQPSSRLFSSSFS